MKKILVPTDFSLNSKSGIRFAIDWANRQRRELTFIHVLNRLKPSTWSEDYYEQYIKTEASACSEQLKKFVSRIYKAMNVKPRIHNFIVTPGLSADLSIAAYCKDHPDIEYICMSTHGAGKFSKFLGTNTGNLLTKSPTPVMAVPGGYRRQPIKNVLYAADLRNYSKELEQVVAFAHPYKAAIDLLHFTWPNEIDFDQSTIDKVFKKPYKFGFKVHFEKNDAVHSFVQNIQKQIELIKPSIVILFTDKQRSLFQKIFLSSKAEELSFQIKIPLLAFNKS